MSFFSGASDASKIVAPRAVPIPRPTNWHTAGDGDARTLKNYGGAPSGARQKKKLPPRSITIAEGISRGANSYEYSTVMTQQANAAAAASATVDYGRSCGPLGAQRDVLYDQRQSCREYGGVLVGDHRIDPFYPACGGGGRRAVGGAHFSPFRRHYAPMVAGVDEPPPPYEIALRMCAPIYERLRRSTASISSLLNSLSSSNNNHSNSHNYNNNNTNTQSNNNSSSSHSYNNNNSSHSYNNNNHYGNSNNYSGNGWENGAAHSNDSHRNAFEPPSSSSSPCSSSVGGRRSGRGRGRGRSEANGEGEQASASTAAALTPPAEIAGAIPTGTSAGQGS